MTKAADNALVPKTCVVMSEFADITETLLKNKESVPLLAALNDQAILKHFKSLIVCLPRSFTATANSDMIYHR